MRRNAVSRRLLIESKLEEYGESVLILRIALALNKGENILETLVGDLISSLIDEMLGHVLGLICNKVDVHVTEDAMVFLCLLTVAEDHHHLSADALHRRGDRCAAHAEGFLYVLANGGGSRTADEACAALEEVMKTVRECTDIPCAVDFAYTSPEQAGRFASLADGVIASSDAVKLLAEHGSAAPAYIGDYVRSLKNGISA